MNAKVFRDPARAARCLRRAQAWHPGAPGVMAGLGSAESCEEEAIAMRDGHDDAPSTPNRTHSSCSSRMAAAAAASVRASASLQANWERPACPRCWPLAGDALSHVRAPTLLIVGGNDVPVIGMNQRVAAQMTAETPTHRWSQDVTRHSNALNLEKDVFAQADPERIARSLKRSAEHSERRKSSPFRSAMSMLTERAHPTADEHGRAVCPSRSLLTPSTQPCAEPHKRHHPPRSKSARTAIGLPSRARSTSVPWPMPKSPCGDRRSGPSTWAI